MGQRRNEKKEPLISVIVPIYNTEKYLARCIVSILQQTYKQLELLLINDGSVDHSKEICEQYAAKDERIKVFNMKNEGLSYARNVGIEHARGDYILFVDSDDYIRADMLEKLYDVVAECSAQIGVCGYQEIYTNKTISNNLNIKTKVYSGIEAMSMLYGGRKEHLTFTAAWNKIYDKNLFKELRFPIGKIHEDEFIAYQLLYSAKKVAYISEELYFYCHRRGSITSKFNRQRFDKIEAYKQRIDFNIEHQMYVNVSIIKYFGAYQEFIERYAKTEDRETYIKYKKGIRHEYQIYKQYLTLAEKMKVILRITFSKAFRIFKYLSRHNQSKFMERYAI